MPKGKVAPVPCPDCGGKMWDNSDMKRSAKAPDYSCKDRDNCKGGVWLSDTQRAAASVTKTNGAPARPPIVLDKMMSACLRAAVECAKHLPEGATADHDIILRIAQSLFIARNDGHGILEAEKKALADLAARLAADKAEAERKAAEERARMSQAQPAYANDAPPPDNYYNGEDLPF